MAVENAIRAAIQIRHASKAFISDISAIDVLLNLASLADLSRQSAGTAFKFPLSEREKYSIYPLVSKVITEKGEIPPAESAIGAKSAPRWYMAVFRLRIEEFLALVFFGPMVYFTTKAYFFFKSQGHVPDVFIGDVQRVFAVVIAVAIALLIVRY